MAKMRAKLRIHSITDHGHCQTVKFGAVTGKKTTSDGLDEDNTYAKFTPSAELNITITNPALSGQFKVGQSFYVDFTEAPE